MNRGLKVLRVLCRKYFAAKNAATLKGALQLPRSENGKRAFGNTVRQSRAVLESLRHLCAPLPYMRQVLWASLERENHIRMCAAALVRARWI